MATSVRHFRDMRSAACGIIALVARDRLTHADMLRLRSERLYQHASWSKLTRAEQGEIHGMFRGAVDAWYACGAIVWCHLYQGQYVESEAFRKLGVSYSEIDSNMSAHVWVGTQKPFTGETVHPTADVQRAIDAARAEGKL